MASKVAVLIAAYNGEEVICDALGSILRQSRPPDEVIVVDDGSTDRTCDRVLNWSQKEGLRVHLHVLDRSLGKREFYGPALPRKTGVELSTADVLAYLDQDDLLVPQHISSLAEALERNRDLVLCFADMRVVDQSGVVTDSFLAGKEALKRMSWDEGRGGVLKFRHSAYRSLLAGSYIPTCAVMFNRDAVKAIGGVAPDLGGTDDADLWLRLSRVGRFGYLPAVLGIRRVLGRNLSTRSLQSLLTRHRMLGRALGNASLPALSPEEVQATKAQITAEIPELLYHASREGIRSYRKACRETSAPMTLRNWSRAAAFSMLLPLKRLRERSEFGVPANWPPAVSRSQEDTRSSPRER